MRAENMRLQTCILCPLYHLVLMISNNCTELICQQSNHSHVNIRAAPDFTITRDMPNLASITSIRRQDLRVDDSGRPLSARALTIYNLLCSVYLPATNTTAERAMTRMGLISTKKRLSMIDEKFSTMMFLSDV